MARKPKAANPAEPKKRKMTQAGQSELFIRTAREFGVDETGTESERAFAKVTSHAIDPSEKRNDAQLGLLSNDVTLISSNRSLSS